MVIEKIILRFSYSQFLSFSVLKECVLQNGLHDFLYADSFSFGGVVPYQTMT